MENKYLYYLGKLREVFIWSEYDEHFVSRADRVLEAAKLDPDFPMVYWEPLREQHEKLSLAYHRYKLGL